MAPIVGPLPFVEHPPRLGSRNAADAIAVRLEQLRDSCTDHGFAYAVECIEDARDHLARFAAGEVRA